MLRSQIVIVIDDGLSTGGGVTGIGGYAGSLFSALKEDSATDVLQVRLLAHPLLSRLPRVLRRFGYLIWLESHHRHVVADILHFANHYFPSRRRPETAYVATIHDLGVYTVPDTFPSVYVTVCRKHLQRAARLADRLITTTNAMRMEVATCLNVPLDRISVCSNAIRPEFLEGVTQRRSPSEQVVLFVGTLERRKNLVTLVKAVGLLRASFPGLHLVLVGRRGYGYQDIRREVISLGLEHHVTLPGYVPTADLVSLYRGASVFVLPSLYEGFGIPLLEAMALGVPVVASNIAAFREVAGGIAVLYSPPRDEVALAKAIGTVLEGGVTRDTLNRGTFRAKQYTFSRMVREHLEAYRCGLLAQSTSLRGIS